MKQHLTLLLLITLIITNCDSQTTKVKTNDNIQVTKDTVKPVKVKLKITKDFVLGKFEYRRDSTFIKVDPKYSNKELFLKNETYSAFLKMRDSASKDGVELKIISGTRNFKEQKAIWERKWKRYSDLAPLDRAKKILRYSSMPCSSRHHWGTDIDLNSLNNSYFNSGKGLREYQWLSTNANHFGFYQVYTEKSNGRTGYNLERWHWSYLPLANQYLEFYNSNINDKDITGFSGSELASELQIIEEFVNGISKAIKNYK